MSRKLLTRLAAFGSAATVTLTLASCSDEPDTGSDETNFETDSVEEAAPEDSEETTDNVSAEFPSNAAEAMSAEDGWTQLHDLDIPEPGTGVLELGGETYTLEVSCQGPGVDPDKDYLLFELSARGNFETVNGHSAYVEVKRHVTTFEEWDLDNGTRGIYGYPGQDHAEVFVFVSDGETVANAAAGGPWDDNPLGEGLPLVHASPEGAFTVQTEFDNGDLHGAPAGGTMSLAGQCEAPWDQL